MEIRCQVRRVAQPFGSVQEIWVDVERREIGMLEGTEFKSEMFKKSLKFKL